MDGERRMKTQKLRDEFIDAAILGYEEQKRRIDGEISNLRAMRSGAQAERASAESLARSKRKISAAGRKKMSEGQRKRWARLKDRIPSETATLSKPKRTLSPAGRAAIAAATRKRWAAYRAAAKATEQ